jgi:hypothetical protein
MKSDFTTFSQKWSPYWDDVSGAKIWSRPWRSRSQHDLAAKSYPAHNFVIWSRILPLFTEMINILRRRVACKSVDRRYKCNSFSAVQRTVTLPCLSLELSHIELCLRHSSKLQKIQNSFLCPKPSRGASPGSNGSLLF